MVNVAFEFFLCMPLRPTHLISPKQTCQQHGDNIKCNIANSLAKLFMQGHEINIPYDTASKLPMTLVESNDNKQIKAYILTKNDSESVNFTLQQRSLLR